jgi:transmembrane 9 superfamily protein 2/4
LVKEKKKKFFSFFFCLQDNLGEILAGDRIENSPYQLQAGVDTACRQVCKPRKYTAKEMERFRTFIAEEYKAQWMVDGLPAAYRKV